MKMYFIGGASKSGTTALYYYLKQHPDLFLPEKKELHYFSRSDIEHCFNGPGDKGILDDIPKNYAEYIKHYSKAASHQLCIDISPSYLYHSKSSARIKQQFPDSKIVFILRNPADKAFSQYLHLRTNCRESETFENALRLEPSRKRNGYSDMWLYRESGYYADSIDTFIHVFGRNAIKIFLFEDFIKEPLVIVREICNFFGVESNIDFKDPGQVNTSALPKSELISKLLLRHNRLTRYLRRILPPSFGRWGRAFVRRLNAGEKIHIPNQIRDELLLCYKDDILRLESLTGKKTNWITAGKGIERGE